MKTAEELQFMTEVEDGKAAEAYLLLGRSHAILSRLAIRFSATWLQSSNPRENPDFFCLDPSELGVAGIQVAHITPRGSDGPCLERTLLNKPTNDLGRRAVVLAQAERMSPEAQTALLKTLEEPPLGTLIFLTSLGLDLLSPAIRSRCRLVRVPPRDSSELRREAAASGIGQEEWGILQAACGDSETALSLSPSQRKMLLEAYPEFVAWLAGETSPDSLIPIPASRDRGALQSNLKLLFAAFFSWSVGQYSNSSDSKVFAYDQLLESLLRAQEDLAGELSPQVVCDDYLLWARGFRLPTP